MSAEYADTAATLPKLHIVAVQELLRFCRCFSVIDTIDFHRIDEVAVVAHDVNAIVAH